MIALKNILVATDFGDAADAALIYGRALAQAFGAALHVLHVRENVFLRPITADPHTLNDAALKKVHQQLTDGDRRMLHACTVVETSDTPADAIVGYARRADIDLIITGTHGRRGVSHALIGSVAEHIVRTAPCPVLTVRHPEHEFVRADDQQAALM
jgi:nucleotide-binding universal stress UspA family protein